MRTRMSRKAEMDLAEITDFIALDSPRRAERFEEELLDQPKRSLAHRLPTSNVQISSPAFDPARMART